MRLQTHHLLCALRILGIAGCITSALVLNAQTTISAIGNPNESARFPIENGFINLGDGNVHLEIPIASYPQRGDLSVAAKFVYDSSIWQVVTSPGYHNPEWYPALTAGSYDSAVYGGLGWTYQYGRYYEGNATIISYPCPASTEYNSTVVYSNIQWSDPQGTLHAFPITTTYVGNCPNSTYTDTPGGQGYAVDGSGYYAVVSNYTTLQIWDSKGTQVVNMSVSGNGESGNPTIDRNGNFISYNQQGSITADSLQHPNITENVISWDSYGNPAVVQLTVPIAQSQTATYTVTYKNVLVGTDFHVSAGPFGSGGYVEEFNGFINVIASIGLPDGTSYGFQYDQCTTPNPYDPSLCNGVAYGELTGITLPHGGTVSLGYTSDANAGTTEPARWVSSHSGSDGSTTFQYQYVGNYPNTRETGGYSCQEVTNTATSVTLQSAYIFSNCNGNILPMKVLLSPTSNPSSVDAFALFQYDFSHPCQEGACTGAQWTNLLEKTIVLPSSGSYSSILSGTPGSGLITDIQYQYATPGSGIATSIRQWDFYSGSYPTSLPDSPSGSPTRETDLVLGKTVNYALFPTQKTIVNGSGSTTFTYSYDEASYSGTSAPSGTPNHNWQLAASLPGNLTTISECCAIVGGSSVPLTKHFYYDTAGAIIESADPNNKNTYFGYDSTDTFGQKITLPPTPGLGGTQVAHITKPVFDFNSGQIASFTDQNNQQTTYTYDSLGRLWTVKFSNGSDPVTLKTITYNPSANETDISELQSPGVNISSSVAVDGYGRPSTTTQSGITTTTNYDAQGRLWTVTNPEASTSYSTDGTTTYGYDELNRINSVEMPNSQSFQYNYSLNTVTITDPSGHSTQQVYDAFGDLSEVLEPSATGTPNWSSAWATTYSYNGLGLLSSINQQGGTSNSSTWRTRNFYYDGAGRLWYQTTPEQGTLTFGYDYNGNLTSSQNQNSTNNSVSYSYDADNRMYQEVVSGGPTYSFTYDAQDSSGDSYGVGRLTGTSDGAKTQTVFTHDPMGDVITSQYCLPSGGTCSFGSTPQAEVQAQFDFQGNMTSLTYPDGRQINLSYDLLNRPINETYAAWQGATISTPYSYASNILYYPSGELQSATYGNGIQMGATFDPDQNISSLVYLGSGSALSSKIYTWDTNATNLLSIQDLSAGRTQTFSYDQLNRIASAADTGTTTQACLAHPPSLPAYSETYSIDPWGNLQETAGTLSGSQSFTFTYTPSAGNPSGGGGNQVTGTGVQYDSAGNMQSDGPPFNDGYQYRADGLISGSNGATYTYDALGQRVQKINGSTTTEYIYFGGLLLAEYSPSGDSWTDRIYGPGGALATVAGTQNAVPVYRVSDHLGSLGLTTTTDTLSGITGVASALPFGEMTINSGGDNFPFTDHERDSENSTDATLFRHYAPTQLRWLSPDPDNGSYDLGDPQSLNRYAYVTNRPMNTTDPTGLQGSCSDPLTLCNGSGGGNGGSQAPLDDSGNPYWSYGSEPGPIVSSSFTGGGSFYAMSHSYDAPGALIHESDNAGTENAPFFVKLIMAPFYDAEISGASFADDRPWRGTWHAILAFGLILPGGEEEEAFSRIGSTGVVGERYLQTLGGESQAFFRTSKGSRFVDQLVSGVANESKVGYQSLTSIIRTQIAKDTELLQKTLVEGVNWHFFTSPVTGLRGASQPLLDALARAGIKVIPH